MFRLDGTIDTRIPEKGRLPAFPSDMGTLATVYAVRVVICTGTLMLLMARADVRGGRRSGSG